MFKMELQAEAQHLCDKSFTAVSEASLITQHVQRTLVLMLIPAVDLALCKSPCSVDLF